MDPQRAVVEELGEALNVPRAPAAATSRADRYRTVLRGRLLGNVGKFADRDQLFS
jgi:hypothetical protein